METTQNITMDNYDVPIVPDARQEGTNDQESMYQGAMNIVESMYRGAQFIRPPKISAKQRKTVDQLFTGAIQILNAISSFASRGRVLLRQTINQRIQSQARNELVSETTIEKKVSEYLEDNNCVYVLGCGELDHERNLYDERSWGEYIVQCEGLNLWKASANPTIVQMVNESFNLHYARMGRPGERPPSRIGRLLYLIELSFTGVPSYELEPSTAPFYSIVDTLYRTVVEERIEMVNEYLAGNLTVQFDSRGNVAKITRLNVAPTQQKSVSYGLEGTIEQIHGDFPPRGDLSSQLRKHARENKMDAVSILTTPGVGTWTEGRELALETDREVQEEIARQKKLRKIDGGKKTYKRNRKHRKSHKKHRKSNKKHSRRRSRK
jgi:hypothetical protein